MTTFSAARPSSLPLLGLALVACAVVLVGCSAALNPVAIADARTAADVKTALVNDPDLGRLPIEVRVSGGIARLSGSVETDAQIERAAVLARAVQGVRGVELNLRVGGPAAGPPVDPEPPTGVASEPDGDPRLLAAGASFGWSVPRHAGLRSRVSVGPLFRFGSGRGFGPALALNWFHTTLADETTVSDVASRIHVKPLMAGVGYTFASRRVSVSPSIVGGVAFNSVSVPQTGTGSRVAVEVSNSLVWRPGISMWVDTSRRTAVNVSFGYVMTGLRVTFLEDSQLVRRDVRGDTAIIHAGLAYKIF